MILELGFPHIYRYWDWDSRKILGSGFLHVIRIPAWYRDQGIPGWYLAWYWVWGFSAYYRDTWDRGFSYVSGIRDSRMISGSMNSSWYPAWYWDRGFPACYRDRRIRDSHMIPGFEDSRMILGFGIPVGYCHTEIEGSRILLEFPYDIGIKESLMISRMILGLGISLIIISESRNPSWYPAWYWDWGFPSSRYRNQGIPHNIPHDTGIGDSRMILGLGIPAWYRDSQKRRYCHHEI